MTYYQDLARREGLQATTLRALVEEVFAAPTDRRLYVLASVVNSIRLGLEPTCEAYAACMDILSIVEVEREWLRRHSDDA